MRQLRRLRSVRAGALLASLVLTGLAMSGCAHRPSPPIAVAPATLDQLAYRTAPEPTAPHAYAAPEREPYRLDAGDKLRIVVFGQDGLTNAYQVGANGTITMPLIGPVGARGLTTGELSGRIAARLRQGYIREPHVAVEVETYRPFFILGEVSAPGQYPYVPNMTAEAAVAIAGGFTPRAFRSQVELSRPAPGGMVRANVPVTTLLKPGDTIVVSERWF